MGARYEIGVRGRFGPELLAWFDSLEVERLDAGLTYLRGWFVDPCALHGLLAQLADLGIEVRSLRQLPEGG